MPQNISTMQISNVTIVGIEIEKRSTSLTLDEPFLRFTRRYHFTHLGKIYLWYSESRQASCEWNYRKTSVENRVIWGAKMSLSRRLELSWIWILKGSMHSSRELEISWKIYRSISKAIKSYCLLFCIAQKALILNDTSLLCMKVDVEKSTKAVILALWPHC